MKAEIFPRHWIHCARASQTAIRPARCRLLFAAMAAIGVLWGVAHMQAAVIAWDSFNYVAGGGGSLHAKNGGAGWAGAWATNSLGNSAIIIWRSIGFVLDHAFTVTGPWTNVFPPALSPFPLSPTNTQEYFRLRWERP